MLSPKQKQELFKEYYTILLTASIDPQTIGSVLYSLHEQEAKEIIKMAKMHVEMVDQGLEEILQE